MHQAMREFTVIGEQQQACRVHIKSPDHDPSAGRGRRQAIEHGRSTLRIAAGRHLAERLVVTEHGDSAQRRRRRLHRRLRHCSTIDGDPVCRPDAQTEIGRLAVDLHAPGTDPFFDGAA
jgi:hypothetical protein